MSVLYMLFKVEDHGWKIGKLKKFLDKKDSKYQIFEMSSFSIFYFFLNGFW